MWKNTGWNPKAFIFAKDSSKWWISSLTVKLSRRLCHVQNLYRGFPVTSLRFSFVSAETSCVSLSAVSGYSFICRHVIILGNKAFKALPYRIWLLVIMWELLTMKPSFIILHRLALLEARIYEIGIQECTALISLFFPINYLIVLTMLYIYNYLADSKSKLFTGQAPEACRSLMAHKYFVRLS